MLSEKLLNRKLISAVVVFTLLLVLAVVAGCGGQQSTQEKSKASGGASAPKTMPDQMTKLKVAIVTNGISRLPLEIADEKGFFKKYNLEPEFVSVQGGPTALRGLQTGDFLFGAMLPDPIISGAAEGSDVKIIGALTNQSAYSFYVTKDIKTAADLKGKSAAVMSAGHGTDIIMRWWLKKNGLEPEKDVKITFAGGVNARLEAVKNNQAQVTLLTPPADFVAGKAGLTQLGLLRDDLKNFNQDVITANGKMLKENPEIARAFMAAVADAMELIKDSSKRDEVTTIGTKRLKSEKDSFTAGLEFSLPAFGDKGKVNVDGIEYSINFLKESGSLKKDVKASEVVDEGYYKP